MTLNIIDEIMNAQAELQVALGFYRLDKAQNEITGLDLIEDKMMISLARLHRLLEQLGKPMYHPAQHPKLKEDMETQTAIELPTTWIVPEGTLEPLLEKNDPQWFTIMNFVCEALRDAGNDESVLISYRDQAMSGDFRHLVQVSMVFMGEIELEHDGVPFL